MSACFRTLTLAVSLGLAGHALAADVPGYTGYVNDLAGKLTPDERAALEAKLVAYEKKTTNEITVLTVPTLDGEEMAAYATRVFKEWKIGKANKNNGALIAYAEAERKYHIVTGYGLEGALPDATVSRIGRELLKPKIRRETFAALDATIDRIDRTVAGEFLAEPEDEGVGDSAAIGLLIAFALIVAAILGLIHWLVGGVVGGLSGWLASSMLFGASGAAVLAGALIGFAAGCVVAMVARAIASSSGGGSGGWASDFGSSGSGSGSGSSSSFSFGGGDSGGGGAGGGAD